MQHYFLDRKKNFIECEVVKNNRKNRRIVLLEGPKKGKEISIHPDGVAWGKMYPRLFKSENHPLNYFIFKGRVLMNRNNVKKEHENLIPIKDKNFRFQPFLTHVIDCVNSHENVLLTGGTGVGKTTHVEQLANRTNTPLLRVNFNGETRLSDFIGKPSVIGGETKYIYGILPTAMKYGFWLLLDELDFADPSVLSLLHPVLEENPILVLKENEGEVIKAHPNFRIFATANSIGAMKDRASSYSGTNDMNEAFIDRWTVLSVPNLSQSEELKVLKNKVAGIKHRWAVKIVDFANKVRSKNLEGYEFSAESFSTRRVIHWAKKSALLNSPIAGAKLAWLDKMPASEHEVLERILNTHFGNNKKKSQEGVSIIERKHSKRKIKRN